MDHIPRLSGSSKPLCEVRYLPCDNVDSYDGSSTETFTERFCSAICENSSEQDAIAQDWLFFGTLARLADLHGFMFEADDFKAPSPSGEVVLSTRLLGQYLGTWTLTATKKYYRCLKRAKRSAPDLIASAPGDFVRMMIADPWAMDDLATQSLLVLETVAHALRQSDRLGIKLSMDLRDTIVLLNTTLLSTVHFLFRGLGAEGFPDHVARVEEMLHWELDVQKITELFDANGWCVRGAQLVRELLGNDPCAVIYCAQLDCRHDNANHEACTATCCFAYQINDDDYRTRHVQADCSCDFVSCDPDEELRQLKVAQASRFLPQKFNNVAMMTCKGGELKAVMVPLAGVEIGRLVSKISQSLDLTTSTSRCVAISHVWADGLGNAKSNALPECQIARLQVLANKLFPSKFWPIPFWIDTLCIPLRDAEARAAAIAQMERTYKTATKILVIDSGLTAVSIDAMKPEEIAARIMTSGWAQRLWTLQEGAYLWRVHWLFADAVMTYEDLHKAIKKTWSLPNLYPDLLPKSYPGIINDLSYKVMNPVWPRIARFFKETSITTNATSIIYTESQDRLTTVMRAVRSRTTSKLRDEALVIAGLLSITAGSAEAVQLVPVEERLRWLMMNKNNFSHYVPLGLIFLNNARYEEDGSRWLSKSLLSQNSPNSRPLSLNTEQGTVAYTSEKLLGLKIILPAVSLKLSDASIAAPAVFRFTSVGHECGALRAYTGRIYEAGSLHPPSNLPTENLILILPTIRPLSSKPSYYREDWASSDERKTAPILSESAKAQIAAGNVQLPARFVGVLASVKSRPQVDKVVIPDRPIATSTMPVMRLHDAWFWEVRHEALVDMNSNGDDTDAEAIEVTTLMPNQPLAAMYCLKIL